jgi:hypothetical protein
MWNASHLSLGILHTILQGVLSRVVGGEREKKRKKRGKVEIRDS